MLITPAQTKSTYIICLLIRSKVKFREWNSYLQIAYLFNFTTICHYRVQYVIGIQERNFIRNVASISILIVYSTLSCASQPLSLTEI